MENLKLVSVRLDPDTLRKIDELAKRYDYYTRSSIINNILTNIINCSDGSNLWKIISTYSPHTCGYTVDFHVDKEKLEKVKYND